MLIHLLIQAYLGEQDPHIYAIANEAYRNLWKTDETQCVLIRYLTSFPKDHFDQVVQWTMSCVK